MEKSLIIGLDLSFSKTGITIAYLEDNVGKTMQFHRIIFDEEKNKSGKRYKPESINNVHDVIYRMPTNINIFDLIIDVDDGNTIDQCEVTLKKMISSKNIVNIIRQAIDQYKPDIIYCAIENYIMPSFGGKASLKSVGGLIMLQGDVRSEIIKECIARNIQIKLITPTASSLKLYFTHDGNADKLKMLKSFINNFDGDKLIPGINIMDLAKVNDVIDSFALVMYTYSKIVNRVKDYNVA